MTTLNIYLTNLGKYNEGFLVGEWVSLPATKEELEKALKRIGINEHYEEYFITDFESNMGLHVGEYDNLDELNETAEALNDLDEYEKEIVKALIEDGYTVEDAIDKKDDVFFYPDCNNMTDVAYQYVEESGLLDNVPDTIARYFDYEALGRDMNLEGNFIFTENGNCIQVL